MYVCLCKNITDTDIREAVEQGANSFGEVSKRLGVATVCGSCASVAREVIESTSLNATNTDDLFYRLA